MVVPPPTVWDSFGKQVRSLPFDRADVLHRPHAISVHGDRQMQTGATRYPSATGPSTS